MWFKNFWDDHRAYSTFECHFLSIFQFLLKSLISLKVWREPYAHARKFSLIALKTVVLLMSLYWEWNRRVYQSLKCNNNLKLTEHGMFISTMWTLSSLNKLFKNRYMHYFLIDLKASIFVFRGIVLKKEVGGQIDEMGGDARHSTVWNINRNSRNGSFHNKIKETPYSSVPVPLHLWVTTRDSHFYATRYCKRMCIVNNNSIRPSYY